MLLRCDLRCDHDPLFGRQRLGSGISAGNATKLNVRGAAGHDKPARSKHAFFLPAKHGDLALEAHGFPVILPRFLGYIPVPQRVVLVVNLDHRSVYVERQGVLNLVKGGGAVGIVIENIHPAVGRPGKLVEGHHIFPGGQPVENHHLGTHQLVHNQIAHIGVVGHNGGGIGKHDLLGNDPFLGEPHV